MSKVELTAREELYEIAKTLREADEAEKLAKELKDDVRGPFFELISEVIREEIPLARKTVKVEVDKSFDIDTWRAQEFPEWRICALNQEGDTMAITLEENESFKKFEFEVGGFKYGRQIRMVGKGFNAQGFYEEVTSSQSTAEWNGEKPDPLLEVLAGCIQKEEVVTYTLDETKAMKAMADYPETVALFQEFTSLGTPTAALLPIKPVKEEEQV